MTKNKPVSRLCGILFNFDVSNSRDELKTSEPSDEEEETEEETEHDPKNSQKQNPNTESETETSTKENDQNHAFEDSGKAEESKLQGTEN